MKIVNYDPVRRVSLVSIDGSYNGPGYIVNHREGTAHFERTLEIPRKFDYVGGFRPVTGVDTVPEEDQHHAFRTVEAHERKRQEGV